MAPWVAPVIAAGAQLIGQWIQNRQQKKQIREMNRYNSPKNQMKRYREAGLNDALIYGQGSPGLQTQIAQSPNYGQSIASGVDTYNQTRLADSTISANEAKSIKAVSDVSVNEAKEEILRKNPLLDEGYLNSLIELMRASAQEKAAGATVKEVEAEFLTTRDQLPNGNWDVSNGTKKMQVELDTLLKRFDLLNQDSQVKAEIIKSKEFQNAILEVQKNFMQDGDITPEHFILFIKLLMQKL